MKSKSNVGRPNNVNKGSGSNRVGRKPTFEESQAKLSKQVNDLFDDDDFIQSLNDMGFLGDIIDELKTHLDYYKAIKDGMESTFKEHYRAVKGIIKKREESGVLSIEDFCTMDYYHKKFGFLNVDGIKALARIRLLYQLSAPYGVEKYIKEPFLSILNSIVSDDTQDFMFFSEKGVLHFKKPDMKTDLINLIKSNVKEKTLEERYSEIKSFYDSTPKYNEEQKA